MCSPSASPSTANATRRRPNERVPGRTRVPRTRSSSADVRDVARQVCRPRRLDQRLTEQLDDAASADRGREEVALTRVNADVAQALDLVGELNSLRNDAQAQSVAEGHDRSGELPVG